MRLALEALEDRLVPSTVTEVLTLPTANAAPTGITKAADGSVWFTERGANKLGRISSTGVLTEYVIPTANSTPEQITASPDGFVWFTERTGKKIGRINQSGGSIKEFVVPGYGAYPTAITTRGDGTVWFASVESSSVARLGKISSTGVVSMLPSANSAATISSLVGGPDGNLWVTRVSSRWGDSVSKVNTTGNGSWTHYKLPTAGSNPQSITVGSDGNLWFTEKNASKIGRITTAGVLTEFALPSGRAPQQITLGSDGNLWFTEYGGNAIGQITPQGVITEFTIPTASSKPYGIMAGPDGNLWFTEQGGNKIGKVLVTAAVQTQGSGGAYVSYVSTASVSSAAAPVVQSSPATAVSPFQANFAFGSL
jgi:streptogramin lyase